MLLSEPPESYQKRRPLCIDCGKIKKMKTQGGVGNKFKTGKHIDLKGYVRVWIRSLQVYKKEHLLVWEENFGKIPNGYIVHHIDGDKINNKISNLQCMSKIEHDKINPGIKHAADIRWHGKDSNYV